MKKHIDNFVTFFAEESNKEDTEAAAYDNPVEVKGEW